MTPTVSIVISSCGVQEASWDRLRTCLQSVAAQEADEAIEVVLLEMAGLNREAPEDIRESVPGLRQIACASRDPWARRSEGVRNATAPIVVFLDADCVPDSRWLGSMLETFRFYPEVAAVRGSVDEEGLDWRRLMRPEPRAAGPVSVSAENNIAFRREAYLDCPFHEGTGTDAVRLQAAALRRAHYVLWAEPKMHVTRQGRHRKPALSERVRYSTAGLR